ncbi:MAG TPA: tetratricopeptide repeat protein [Gemmatimonadaceae bacterium]|nr:tetratricopeptide repeat protein [Gemmatimonadaceae bacterium]
MSLISDALKTAQRERGRQRAGEPPQMIDGFFPYVATAPKRDRSRVGLVVAVSLASVALIAVVLWVALPRSGDTPVGSPTTAARPLAEAPLNRDTAARSTADSQVAEAGDPLPGTDSRQSSSIVSVDPRRTTTPDRNVARQAPAPIVTAAPPAASRGESLSRGADVPMVAPPASSRAGSTAAERVDYEAQATVLFNAGDLVGARDRFLLATRNAPTARAWTNYGVTLQRLGDLGGASAAYQSALGIDANYLEAWLYQGRLAVQLGDVAKAIPLFQRALAINPRHAEVNVELARLEWEARNWSESRRFAAEAVRSDPANPYGHWYLAVSADQLRDLETARREYTAYLQTVGSAEREQSRFVGWARQRLAEIRDK